VKKLIFFDIDKTLIDENYNPDRGLVVVNRLKKMGFDVILNSSKTRKEQEYYREVFGLSTPFIVENGSGVYIPDGFFPGLTLPERGGYLFIQLGVPYEHIVENLREVEGKYGLKYYANSTLEEVKMYLGMDDFLARLAREREFSETIFEFRDSGFVEVLSSRGLTCQQGSRFISVLGKTDKGRGMERLVELYKKYYKVKTFAVGDGKNDFPMFDVADESFLIGERSHPRAKNIHDLMEILNYLE